MKRALPSNEQDRDLTASDHLQHYIYLYSKANTNKNKKNMIS